MLYIIYASFLCRLPKEKKCISIHHNNLEYLQLLQNEGRLLTAGLIPAVDSKDPGEAGFVGSIIIAEFESLEEAQNWAMKHHLHTSKKMYNKVLTYPYKKIF